MKPGLLVLLILSLLIPQHLLAADGQPPMVMSVSWSSPDTRYLNQHIDEFTNLPFTGTDVTVSYPQLSAGSVLGGSNEHDNLSWYVFQANGPAITDTMVAGAISDLQATNFSGARDSFLKVVTYPRDGGWDWFNDAAWNKVLNNIGKMARVAYQGNLKGFALDPEEYGVPMWSWGGSRPEYRLADLPEYVGRTWTEIRSKVYQRGISFGQAMTAEFPGIDVWTLYGYSHIVHGLRANPPADLSDTDNGLYAAFFDGMLRGTNDYSIFIDGGEGAYRYVERSEFAALRDSIDNLAQYYTIESVRYPQKIRVGFGLYLDQYRYEDSLPWDSDDPHNNYMTPAGLEYRLANALAESDGYVWVYSEIPSWWLDSGSDSFGAGVLSRSDHGWVDHAYSQAIENALPLPFTEIGDVNFDDAVDFEDLALIAPYYETAGGLEWIHGDFDDDGFVTMFDLDLMALNFGLSPVSAPMGVTGQDLLNAIRSIPEPGTVLILVPGVLVMQHRRRTG